MIFSFSNAVLVVKFDSEFRRVSAKFLTAKKIPPQFRVIAVGSEEYDTAPTSVSIQKLELIIFLPNRLPMNLAAGIDKQRGGH
ncbi:MAG: hypothetical protein ALAOOOJD_04413 [bacterium]|nr:hypothetical protein [bacterium]